MYLSKLGAEKEFQFMQVSFQVVEDESEISVSSFLPVSLSKQFPSFHFVDRLTFGPSFRPFPLSLLQLLHSNHFPVPTPISHSRHSIVMSLIDDAYPLRQIISLPLNQIPILYSSLMKLIVRLARSGLIHGDFNEFNLLIKESKEIDQDYKDQDEEEIEEQSRLVEKEKRIEKSERIRGNGIKVEEMRDRLNEVEKDGDDEGFDLRGKAQFRRNGGLLKLDRDREVVENGNGFQRIVSVRNDDEEESDESEEEENSDDEDEDEEREAEEEEKIHFKDGTIIEPVLIDFPQMVSVEHENAE